MKTEFIESTHATWPEDLLNFLKRENLWRVLYGPRTPIAEKLASAWPENEGLDRGTGPKLIAYDQPIESMRDVLFNGADVGVTSTLGGIAETGSLILWPSCEEPRLLSLVPPVHVALLDAEKIHDSLPDAIKAMNWAMSMPTNALLVSGPSKTADIEQTLCYGVHGPKRLVVILLAN